jgi:branched-subunit amino acid transport protein
MARKKFYSNAHLYLALGLAVVLLGFGTTYFNRLGDFSLPYHAHGISATLWMILLIVQPYLFQKGKLKAHRYLGWSSLVLVPTLVIFGVIMMRLMIQGQANYPPNLVYQLAFIDACTLFSFFLLYVLALWYRKRLKLHARFMVATIFGPLLPALARMFLFTFGIASNFDQALTYSYLSIEGVLLLIIWKERHVKEVKFTYVPFLVFIALQHALMYSSDTWGWWKMLMDYFANYTS